MPGAALGLALIYPYFSDHRRASLGAFIGAHKPVPLMRIALLSSNSRQFLPSAIILSRPHRRFVANAQHPWEGHGPCAKPRQIRACFSTLVRLSGSAIKTALPPSWVPCTLGPMVIWLSFPPEIQAKRPLSRDHKGLRRAPGTELICCSTASDGDEQYRTGASGVAVEMRNQAFFLAKDL